MDNNFELVPVETKGTRDPRTEKLVRADQEIRSGPRTGPDADQRNFWKSGPERTADQHFFENADQDGPQTAHDWKNGPRRPESVEDNLISLNAYYNFTYKI